MSDYLKRPFIALAVPFEFSLKTGHLRSTFSRRSQDARGAPLPWYTYPAIHFLEGINFSSARVLEFGGGQSTLWWAERATKLLTIEEDPRWSDWLAEKTSGLNHVECVLRENLQDYADYPAGQEFDVVIIDGGDRYLCSQTALKVVRAEGLILLDNAEGFWGQEGTYPVIDLLQESGYSRIDFYGYAPGVRWMHCTSAFFRGRCRFIFDLGPPRRDPLARTEKES
ncbi:MAG: hypothetical protein M3280_10390 [Actinomycetota bacterium]|nr:hypothetical protein [Actinomycetota bacterium]